jgi:hypothetical protein
VGDDPSKVVRCLRVVGGKEAPLALTPETWAGGETAEQILIRAIGQNLKAVVVVGEQQDGSTFIASTFETWEQDMVLLTKGQLHAHECAADT